MVHMVFIIKDEYNKLLDLMSAIGSISIAAMILFVCFLNLFLLYYRKQPS